MSEKITRRNVLKRSLMVLGAAAVGPTVLAACGGEEGGSEAALSCTDTAGLEAAQVQLRTTMAYADTTADPAKKCADCALFTAGAAGACGTCSAIPGTIHPDGTCNAFVARS